MWAQKNTPPCQGDKIDLEAEIIDINITFRRLQMAETDEFVDMDMAAAVENIPVVNEEIMTRLINNIFEALNIIQQQMNYLYKYLPKNN
jgi:hypothetical protein